MRITSFIGLGLLLGLTSCDGAQPAAQFDAVTVNRPLNLIRVLGPRITLTGPGDTLYLRLTYDARTSRSILTNATADTILAAHVFRFRGLYYFVEAGPDSASWVHAVRIGGGEVRGLNTGYQQMQALSSRVQRSDFKELIRFQNPAADSFRLRFDRRQLRAFYAGQADSSPVYHWHRSSSWTTPTPVQPQSAVLVGPYPNPASELTTLDFMDSAPRIVAVYDYRGQHIRSLPTDAARLTLSVANLPAGQYLLRISQTDSGRMLLTRRLLVVR